MTKTMYQVVNVGPDCEYDELVEISDILTWSTGDGIPTSRTTDGYPKYFGAENADTVGDLIEHKSLDPWFEGLVGDLEAEGVQEPLEVKPGGGHLWDGHHRVAAAIQLGWTHLPVRYWGSE